ncbi:MAG TPA: PAS domain-containing protein [Candidatus Limnocylindria bacterium]|nr:PAS domain-containing protein [Candidatus Limnocylindria bacterium]
MIRVLMLTSATVILVTVAAFMSYDLATFRRNMVSSLTTQARLVAENSTAALEFRNENDAEETLTSLRTQPYLLAAALYDAQGRLFVKFPTLVSSNDLPTVPETEGHRFGASALTLYQPVMRGDTRLGTLYLKADLAGLNRRIQIYAVMSLLIVGGSLAFAFWLSRTLQSKITNPIVALAETAQKISRDRDYSLRAPRMSDDELGALTQAFNGMLDRIQASDSALRASEAQFRLVTDEAPVLLAQVDREFRYKFVNQPYAARYGRRPEEVVGRHALEIVGPELFARARPYLDQAYAGQRVQYELEYPGPDREPRWTHAEYTPEKNAAGEVVGILAVHTDITERKQQELRLARAMRETDAQARLFDAMLSSIKDLAYTFDLEGNWTYANEALLKLWGRKLPEIVGKSSLELDYPPELAERLKQQVKTVVSTRAPVRGETYFTDAAGVEDYHEYIFSPVFAADGTVTAVCGTTRLTTERKRWERELEAARDRAVATARAKDDFLAALSHELRTPLNPVLLLASDAADDPQLAPEVRSQFATIRNNVELEARLIDDLLDLTRITNGKLALTNQVLHVHEVLREAISIVRPDAEAKPLTLMLDFCDGEPLVFGDRVRLQQVFWNVLKNAVKFTPPAGRVTVRTLVEAGEVLVRVLDTGIGLSAEELGRVFTAFAQGDHAEGGSHRFGGLGLGLAISQRLAELHSGVIQVASEGRDRGAAFTIRLPLSAATVPNREPRDSDAVAGFPGAAGGRRILLVEDHEATRLALSLLLRRRHYTVIAAASLAEARMLASQSQIDLLISDIGLPDGNGYDLMNELRESYGLSGIALTGYGMEEDVLQSKRTGFAAHLTKPVRIQSLDDALAFCSRQGS